MPKHRSAEQQQLQRAALLAVLVLAAAAQPDYSQLAAAAGSAAVRVAATAAHQFRTTASNGPTLESLNMTNNTATNMSTGNGSDAIVTAADGSDPRLRLKAANDLRAYLESKFKDRPDALSRIKKAWEVEQRDAFKGNGWGYRQPDQDPSVEAMSFYINPPNAQADPATAEAINALYEADHPEHQSRMEELVRGRGYPLERHTVVTSDGYELALFRIPHGKNRNNQPGKRPVAYLQHGVTLASDSFVILNENESLAFILADAGFDVWMGNKRGNTYSRRNVRGLYPYQLEFWYFSIDEVAQIDLPTMLDYVLATTGASKLAYTGHSEGCTLAYMLCAAKPEWNDKFSVIVHMGPVVFVEFFRAPFLRFVATNSLDQLLIALSIGEFLPNRLIAPLYGTLCPSWPLDEVCAAALSFFAYGPSIFITADDYISIATTWPSSVGSRNLVHWAQNFRDPALEMRYFDYGTACNLTKWHPGRGFQPKPYFETCNQAEYGSLEPPVYDLTKVTAPNIMFLGENDVMSVATDVEEEVRRIGPAHRGDFIYTDYGHMDFVWDRNSKHSVDLADVFFRYSPGTF